MVTWSATKVTGALELSSARDDEVSRLCEEWQAVLDDPNETAQFKDKARHELARLAGAAHVGAQAAPEAAGW